MSAQSTAIKHDVLVLLKLRDCLQSASEMRSKHLQNCWCGCAGYFTLRSLLVLCPSYLIYMALIGGLAIPGGLFMPAIMVPCVCHLIASQDIHMLICHQSEIRLMCLESYLNKSQRYPHTSSQHASKLCL